MLLDIIIKINREKLYDMILNHEKYENIVKQSQKLDKYIADSIAKINNKASLI